jgi:hypothetical protein
MVFHLPYLVLITVADIPPKKPPAGMIAEHREINAIF